MTEANNGNFIILYEVGKQNHSRNAVEPKHTVWPHVLLALASAAFQLKTLSRF